MRVAAVILAGLWLAGCATAGEEWTGDGAEAFDTANTACTREAAYTSEAVRPAAYRACMAARGWTHP